MKKVFTFLLVATIGIFAVLFTSTLCKQKIEKQSQEEIFIKVPGYKEYLESNREALKSQLKEVREKYPLVALSYSLQEAVIMQELAGLEKERRLFPILEFMTGRKYSNPSILDRNRALQLLRCLSEANSSVNVDACFNRYGESGD
jgi:hypothetical protein